MREQTLADIRAALKECGGTPDRFPQAAEQLLNAIGYASERKIRDNSCTIKAIIVHKNNGRLVAEKAGTIDLIFQYTEEEIKENLQADDFNDKNHRSFLFFAVALKPGKYNRSDYGQLTREINRAFNAPAVVLFRHFADDNPTITIGFIGRRQNRRDQTREVLETVSLLKDINCRNPHRGHLDTIANLSLRERLLWIASTKGKDKNFQGLLASWLAELSTDILTNRFYRALFAWYEWASGQATFPKTDQKQNHIIRLITRILFIWFIKEKGLVPADFFLARDAHDLVADFNQNEVPKNQDAGNYYRAILQNLFFATLNTEIKDREEKNGELKFSTQTHKDHRNFNVYRYRSLLNDVGKFSELIGKIPFINGGLFDCLDSFASTTDGGYIVDCFSDPAPAKHGKKIKKNQKMLHVPDYLFFDEEKGLFPLLSKYKFTVAENTPVDQEVALEPELLGMVFENLLAEVDTATQQAARNLTGSFYTPRFVVAYMVDESLTAYLQKTVPLTAAQLANLLDYAVPAADAARNISEDNKQKIVAAIARIKILDPAVGSGAFPMGILHKLALVLSRLDPQNKLWKKIQKDIATAQVDDALDAEKETQRRQALDEINANFTRNTESDFGRKLFLIQNSIYGVDTQPIACQIAKLRFFISLAIEQNATDDPATNYGIKPLPNLETKIVAADTLIGINQSHQKRGIQSNAADDLDHQIRRNRQQHFNARSRRAKLHCIRTDRRLRQKLSALYKATGFSDSDAEKIAQWDPYNQTAKADWFDPKDMFGVADGFDIVIANPPYIQLQNNRGELANRYQKQGFQTFTRTGDIYCLFYEKGIQLAKPGGHICYITSNAWMRTEYGEELRPFLSSQNPVKLLNLGAGIFKAAVNTNILLLQKCNNEKQLSTASFKADFNHGDNIRDYFTQNHSAISEKFEDVWFTGNKREIALKKSIEKISKPLKQWSVKINMGIKTGCNRAFVVNKSKREELIDADKNSSKIINPILRGRNISRYQYAAAEWLVDTHNGYKKNTGNGVPAVDVGLYPAVKAHLDNHFPALEKRQDQGTTPYNLRSCAYYAEFLKEKILWNDISSENSFAWDDTGMFLNNTCYFMTGADKFLLGFLNSKLTFWYFKSFIGVDLGEEGLRWMKQYVEKIPVPTVEAERRELAQKIESLVDDITEAKKQNPHADTTADETKIDHLVYQLYHLTPAEIQIIESP